MQNQPHTPHYTAVVGTRRRCYAGRHGARVVRFQGRGVFEATPSVSRDLNGRSLKKISILPSSPDNFKHGTTQYLVIEGHIGSKVYFKKSVLENWRPPAFVC